MVYKVVYLEIHIYGRNIKGIYRIGIGFNMVDKNWGSLKVKNTVMDHNFITYHFHGLDLFHDYNCYYRRKSFYGWS